MKRQVNNKGVLLMYAIIFVAIIVIWLTVSISQMQQSIFYTNRTEAETKAHWAAMAGLEYAQAVLNTDKAHVPSDLEKDGSDNFGEFAIRKYTKNGLHIVEGTSDDCAFYMAFNPNPSPTFDGCSFVSSVDGITIYSYNLMSKPETTINPIEGKTITTINNNVKTHKIKCPTSASIYVGVEGRAGSSKRDNTNDNKASKVYKYRSYAERLYNRPGGVDDYTAAIYTDGSFSASGSKVEIFQDGSRHPSIVARQGLTTSTENLSIEDGAIFVNSGYSVQLGGNNYKPPSQKTRDGIRVETAGAGVLPEVNKPPGGAEFEKGYYAIMETPDDDESSLLLEGRLQTILSKKVTDLPDDIADEIKFVGYMKTIKEDSEAAYGAYWKDYRSKEITQALYQLGGGTKNFSFYYFPDEPKDISKKNIENAMMLHLLDEKLIKQGWETESGRVILRDWYDAFVDSLTRAIDKYREAETAVNQHKVGFLDLLGYLEGLELKDQLDAAIKELKGFDKNYIYSEESAQNYIFTKYMQELREGSFDSETIGQFSLVKNGGNSFLQFVPKAQTGGVYKTEGVYKRDAVTPFRQSDYSSKYLYMSFPNGATCKGDYSIAVYELAGDYASALLSSSKLKKEQGDSKCAVYLGSGATLESRGNLEIYGTIHGKEASLSASGDIRIETGSDLAGIKLALYSDKSITVDYSNKAALEAYSDDSKLNGIIWARGGITLTPGGKSIGFDGTIYAGGNIDINNASSVWLNFKPAQDVAVPTFPLPWLSEKNEMILFNTFK